MLGQTALHWRSPGEATCLDHRERGGAPRPPSGAGPSLTVGVGFRLGVTVVIVEAEFAGMLYSVYWAGPQLRKK